MRRAAALAAVSRRSAPVVEGRRLAGRVIGVFAHGCYLDVEGMVLPVLGPSAYRLPTAAVVPIPPEPWVTLRRGDQCTVGEGQVHVGDWQLIMARTWHPARVRRMPGRPVPERLLDTLAHDLGSGPGLTPEADDVLAGALLVAVARGGTSQRAELLAAAVARTTALSASLIAAAAEGCAVPEAVAYVNAVLAGDPRAARLRSRLESFGHTSGAALCRGVDLAAFDQKITDRGAASA